MENKKIDLPADFKKDFISADGLTAVSGLGNIFNVGDNVTHTNEKERETRIKGFVPHSYGGEILAITDIYGKTPLVFLEKVEAKVSDNLIELTNFEEALATDLLKDGHICYTSSGEEFYLPLLLYKKKDNKWFTTNTPRLYTEKEFYILARHLSFTLGGGEAFEEWYKEYLESLPESLDFHDLLRQAKLI